MNFTVFVLPVYATSIWDYGIAFLKNVQNQFQQNCTQFVICMSRMHTFLTRGQAKLGANVADFLKTYLLISA